MKSKEINIQESKLKISLSAIVFLGIVIQIISTQGILMFNIFSWLGYWQLKKGIHLLGIALVIIPFAIKLFQKRRIWLKTETLLLFSYFLVEYLILIIGNKFNTSYLFYSVREVLLVFVLIIAYKTFTFSKRQFEWLVKLILGLVGLNILFVIINLIIGGEQYMLWVTGRYFWPIDPLLRFKISTFMGLTYRSPGLIGESASVGFFALFAFFFVINSKFAKLFWIPLILLFLSFTRSAYLALFVFGILWLVSINNNKKYLLYVLPGGLMGVSVLYFLGLLSLSSLGERVNNWVNKVNIESSPLFGGNLHLIGNAAPKDSGFVTTMDSYWLFLYHGIGILGIGLVLYFLYKKIAYTNENKFLFIGLVFAGLFVTFSQSIPFLVFFPLLAISNWWCNETE